MVVCLFTEDDVYFPDESLLEEYVLNDQGYIWKGGSLYADPAAWNFGQVKVKLHLYSNKLFLHNYLTFENNTLLTYKCTKLDHVLIYKPEVKQSLRLFKCASSILTYQSFRVWEVPGSIIGRVKPMISNW